VSEWLTGWRGASGRGTSFDCTGPMFPRRVLGVLTRTIVLCSIALISGITVQAQRAIPLGERARGSDQVIIGRVASVTPEWRNNDFGDRLITSIVRVIVEETLKGVSQPSVDVEVEGGTIGNLTLRVSDLETFALGERAVFYLVHSRRGTLVPHLRGLGLQKIDESDRIRGTGVTLDQVRREVQAGTGR
jgi:hypothetical protein